MKNLLAFVGAFILLTTADAYAYGRSYSARAQFKREQPCPATGRPRGPCPGYVVDHVVPLCAGGPDAPSNMQWQTVEDGKRKDRAERRMCRLNQTGASSSMNTSTVLQ